MAILRRCQFCGYDLRGITSKVCPECGRARNVTLRIADDQSYHRARAALERENLLVSFINPGGAMEVLYGTSKSPGWLRVSVLDTEQAESILDDLDVNWSEDAVALVDRADPRCPLCGEDLGSNEPDQCLGCGAGVRWIDSASQIENDDEIVCPACMQQVTLVDGRCPQCGIPVADHRPQPNEPAMRVDDERRVDRRTTSPSGFSWGLWVLATVGVSLLLLILLTVLGIVEDPGWMLGLTLMPAGLIAAYLVARR